MRSKMVQISKVRSEAQAAAVERLAWDFIAWIRDRYPDMADDIDHYLAEQDFANRIKDVRRYYGPPNGDCLLAEVGGEPVGILMLKDIGGGECEMNRMYVSDAARGHGVGRKLVAALLDLARELGFARMRLSALPRHHEALALYRSVGFAEDSSVTLKGNTSNSVRMSLDLNA